MSSEQTRWHKRAQNVEIIRDNWGIPHIYGKTNADVVFGLMYAQCEDDFDYIEYNYIKGLGKWAELDGESRVMNDVWTRAFMDEGSAKILFATLDPWLKDLMHAWADGMNYFLEKNPQIQPRIIKRFHPWYPLLFSEGSSEGNISNQSNVPRSAIADFFKTPISMSQSGEGFEFPDPDGSNGFALAPKKSKNANALLFINPHVNLYHRAEAHLISKEGLNCYGAISKGQFFIYHGFNNNCGWSRTSGGADTQDAFLEELRRHPDSGQLEYRFGSESKAVKSKTITVKYDSSSHTLSKEFEIYYTHHGPVMAQQGNEFISITPLHRPEIELEQQWKTMFAGNLNEFKATFNLRSNSTNNTIYADKDGNIALWNGNFVPKRRNDIDWSKPVESKPENEWQGLLDIDQIVHAINPESGWLQNCNSSPFACCGPSSPNPNKYPDYTSTYSQNSRAINAERVLTNQDKFSLDDLILAGHNSYLSSSDILISRLKNITENAKVLAEYKSPINTLINWNGHAAIDLFAPAIYMEWLNKLLIKRRTHIKDDKKYIKSHVVDPLYESIKLLSPNHFLDAFYEAINSMKEKYGTWKIKMGDIYRLQRVVDQNYSDDSPSVPSRFLPGYTGSLSAGNYDSPPDQNKKYLRSGNSFICAVEFGDSIKAKSIIAGGVTDDPLSPHYFDQAEQYVNGKLKDVFFYKDDVLKHAKIKYNPGFK